MRKHLFTLFIILSSLAMCAAAWLVKNGAFAPRAVGVETRAQVDAAEDWLVPVSGAALTHPFGAEFDEATGQWSLREAATLRAEYGAFVRAMRDGQVLDSREADGAWIVSIAHEGGAVVSYGGLRAGPAAGRRVSRGELIGQLAGDTLDLAMRIDGILRDPAEILSRDESK